MANKLYEEESVRAIANAIRNYAPTSEGSRSLVIGQMAGAISSVAGENYNNGRKAGLTEGADKVKTEEARTEEDITTEYDVPQNLMYVTVPQGYYAKTEEMSINADPFYDDGYDAGYDTGYSDGLADGGGGSAVDYINSTWLIAETPDLTGLPTGYANRINVSFTVNNQQYIGIYTSGVNIYYARGSTASGVYVNGAWTNSVNRTITINEEITDSRLYDWLTANATLLSGTLPDGGGGNSDADEMMLLDEYHDWEGEPPFYSIFKYLDYEISSLSSIPVVVSVGNNHESKYLHVYVYAETITMGEIYETLVVPPADEEHDWYGFNSVEIPDVCYHARIWGIRWSDDGV